MQVYPLRFHPIFKQPLWGGNKLMGMFASRFVQSAEDDATSAELGAGIEAGLPNLSLGASQSASSGVELEQGNCRLVPDTIGEIWEIHGQLRIANGCYKGLTLDELSAKFGADLLGELVTKTKHFPLLVKWLDAADWLSLQVHPDDALARLISDDPQANGKTECWYVVESGQDAQLICGLRPGCSADEFCQKAGAQLLDHVNFISVQSGDSAFVGPGVVHALGPEVTVLEIQQSSDITYRLHDWDRLSKSGQPRELHIPQAHRCLLGSEQVEQFEWRELKWLGKKICACRYFAVEAVSAPQSERTVTWCGDGNAPQLLAMVRGAGRLWADQSSEELLPGQVYLVGAKAQQLRVNLQKDGEFVRITIPVSVVKSE